MVIFKVAMES